MNEPRAQSGEGQAWQDPSAIAYALLGSFESTETAAEAGRALAAMLEAQSDWFERDARIETDGVESGGVAGSGSRGRAAAPPDESSAPLNRFIQDHALTPPDDEGGICEIEWPERGTRPRALLLGSQVLVHCLGAASLPRCLGEFVYRQGGRVDLELVEAQHPLVVRLRFWAPWGWAAPAGTTQAPKQDSLREALERRVCQEFCKPGTPPVWRAAASGTAFELICVFAELMPALTTVRECCDEHAMGVQLRLAESLPSQGDLLRSLR